MKLYTITAALIGAGLACLPVCAAPSLRDSLNQNRAVQMPLSVVITNTGSTNTAGYRIELDPNGQARYRILGLVGRTDTLQHQRISQRLVNTLYRDIKAAQPLSALPVIHGVKSVSFGTSTYIVYGNQRTPDLSSPADSRGRALAADVQTITATLGLKNLPRRPAGLTPPAVPGH